MTTVEFLNEITQTYDTLTAKVKADLDEQYSKGRIKGTDYANVYVKLMSEALNLSIQEPIQRAQQDLLSSQKTTEESKKNLIDSQKLSEESKKSLIDSQKLSEDLKRNSLIPSQIDLTNRQRQGFDDNMKLKMLDSQLKAWSLMFSSGLLDDKPTIITNDEASALYNNMKSELGI